MGEGLDLVGTIEICIVAAAVLAVVFHKLKQPSLLAYIVAGLLLAGFWRPWFGGSIAVLEQVSHFGLVLLLFVIGLELDLRGVFRLGPRAAAAVLLQTPVAVADALAVRMARDTPELLARTLVVDYNVKNHAKIRSRGARAAYGDISNPETLRHHGVLGARVLVSTVGDAFLRDIGNKQLVRQLKAMNPGAFVVATADSGTQADELRAAGADACVSPADDAAASYIEQIRRGLERPAGG